MRTILLTRSQVEMLLDPALLVEQLRAGFIAYSETSSGRAQRVRSPVPGPGTATVLFPGTVPGLPVYTVKVHAKFPAQQPAIKGVLCVHDVHTGDLIAVMDSTYLTAVRTGIAGALAAHVLARPDADTVAVIGAGVQGRFQLRALTRLRRLKAVRVHDALAERAHAFVSEMSAELAIAIETASSADEAVREVGIVLVATWSTTPFILPAMLARGTHVTTLGADEPGKAEVSADVITSSLFVCDDRDLAVTLGALCGVGLGREAVGAELGDVLAGRHPGRTSSDQITVYGGVGLAFQDAVAGWLVYQAAMTRGVGQSLNFLE